MKEKILDKACDMFLNLGFKSVTMDDIASKLGISKKTLYKYCPNKTHLVAESTALIHDTFTQSIAVIKSENYNSIEEEFAIKAIFKEMLKNAKNSPMFQLKKYYPEIYQDVIEKELELFKECCRDNLEKGIAQGFFREDIDIALTIQFYFTLVFGVFDNDQFHSDVKKIFEIEYKILEYHIRSIATPKGLLELEKQLNLTKQNQ